MDIKTEPPEENEDTDVKVKMELEDFEPEVAEIQNKEGNFECTECHEEYDNIESFKLHKAVHDPRKFCPVCDREFKIIKHFISHISAHLKTVLRCEVCPKVFFSKKIFNSHVLDHKNINKIKKCVCEFCEKRFGTNKELTVHIRVHTNERPYKCTLCDKDFKQSSSLRTHMNTHSEEKKFVCELCEGNFSTSSSLKRHIRRVHEAGRSKQCKICDQEFFSIHQFLKHKAENHPEVATFVRCCPICKEKFTSRHFYNIHKEMHTNDLATKETSVAVPHRCAACGEVLRGTKNFNEHQREHLQMTPEELKECERNKQYICKICGRANASKTKCIMHMDKHAEKTFTCGNAGCTEVGPYTFLHLRRHSYLMHDLFLCVVCKESFDGYRKFRKHSTSHPLPPKQHSCKLCGKTFRYKNAFVIHTEQRHKNNVNCYQCQVCNKKFFIYLNFKKHMNVQHNKTVDNREIARVKKEKIEADPNKRANKFVQKFYCKICNRCFQSKEILQQHLKTHNSKYFQCNRCDKLFSIFRNFQHHVQSNVCQKWVDTGMKTDTNDFRCVICIKECYDERSLSFHMNRIHSKTGYKCRLCKVIFTNLKTLSHHTKVKHFDSKQRYCTFCDITFVTFLELIKHRSSVHRKKVLRTEKSQAKIKEEPNEIVES